jgi:FKBP-type peptidyl-prolyl cis-trans isomerase (trigger factor)
MFTHTVKKLPHNTIEVRVQLSAETTKEQYPKAFETIKADLALQGFRKGKVPDSIAQKYIPEGQVYEEVINGLLQEAYSTIIKDEKLEPVVKPKVALVKGEAGKDWEFTLTTALKPTLTLPNVRAIVKKVKADHASKKEEVTDEQPKEGAQNFALLSDILAALVKDSKLDVSPLILDEEKSARMQKLQTDITSAGMTMETYLESRKKTKEELSNELDNAILDSYASEYAIYKIAEEEKIHIEDKDILPMFENAKTDSQKAHIQSQLYQYGHLIQRQKVFDFLLGLESYEW